MNSENIGPTKTELDEIFLIKYGVDGSYGWGPRMRRSFGYFTPDEVYEALIAKLVGAGCAWIDVGCGRDIFPDNRPLARILADRCGSLVGVDPDDTLNENKFVHKKERCTIDDFRSDEAFDVVSLRMVAEHIIDPGAAIASLSRLTRPGGRVVVYTVNQRSPVAIAARIIPFKIHHTMKYVLWETEEEDTFPVAYRMNTRNRLARLFEAHGFCEVYFAYVDDCRTFGRFRILHYLELLWWRSLRSLGVRYPENCLLGVYERK